MSSVCFALLGPNIFELKGDNQAIDFQVDHERQHVNEAKRYFNLVFTAFCAVPCGGRRNLSYINKMQMICSVFYLDN